jgi:hypothetical protein
MTVQAEVNGEANDGDQNLTDNADDTNDAGVPTTFAENLSIETATADVQRCLEDYPDEYPYAPHFHPDMANPIIAFDPTVIQDDFDPFDIGNFVNFNI